MLVLIKLPLKITLAGVGPEISANGPIVIEGDESSIFPVEPICNAVTPHVFEYVSSDLSISQRLRLQQILLNRDRTKLGSVLVEVFAKFLLRSETNTGSD